MTGLPSAAQVERFRSLLAQLFGLHFEDGKLELLTGLLERRSVATGRLPEAYLDGLAGAERREPEELQALVQALTVTETYFFRNAPQLRAFTEEVLLPWARGPGPSRPLRILSAGCASGEEPYTLAMLAREHLSPAALPLVSIRGVDLNAAMLQKAARARYSAWSLRETAAEAQQRWFRTEGRELVLDERIRAAVTFEPLNLADPAPLQWAPGSLDVVFCRNVLMYFRPEVAQAIVARMERALVPGGHLFLGHAETLRGLSQSFDLLHTHGTFYYRRREAAASALQAPSTSLRPPLVPLQPPLTPPPVGVAAAAAEAGGWEEAIRRSSARIQSLAEGCVPGALAGETQVRTSVSRTLELLQQERFAEAQAALRELPSPLASDPEVLLLEAVLLTHGGDLRQAERVCTALLEQEALSPGAHYLMALCRESAGDRRGAAEHDEAALHLDPGFALPRLHLGLLARRAGEREVARRELGQALLLLQREEPSRILLFGGGFSRAALVRLCRSELLACGGVA